jgi:hypothetical protein
MSLLAKVTLAICVGALAGAAITIYIQLPYSPTSSIASNKSDSEGAAREGERSRDAEEREREGQERADASWWQREKEKAREGLERWEAQTRQAGEDPFAPKKQTKEEIDQQALDVARARAEALERLEIACKELRKLDHPELSEGKSPAADLGNCQAAGF